MLKLLQLSGNEFVKCFVDDTYMAQMIGIKCAKDGDPDVIYIIASCAKPFSKRAIMRAHLYRVYRLSRDEAERLVPDKPRAGEKVAVCPLDGCTTTFN